MFDDGVRKEEEAEVTEEPRKEVLLLEGVRRDDGNGKRDGAGVGIDVGTGAGEVATGPGVSADTMDWETSERSMDARFWLLENTSPPSFLPTFPHPPPTTVSDPAPGIDEGGAGGERLIRNVFLLGASGDSVPSASISELDMPTAVTDASIPKLDVPRTMSEVASRSALPRPRSTLVLVLLYEVACLVNAVGGCERSRDLLRKTFSCLSLATSLSRD